MFSYKFLMIMLFITESLRVRIYVRITSNKNLILCSKPKYIGLD